MQSIVELLINSFRRICIGTNSSKILCQYLQTLRRTLQIVYNFTTDPTNITILNWILFLNTKQSNKKHSDELLISNKPFGILQ
ncbi:Uncharacterized protein BM_BM1516 [Brugia malayi]|uniref:Bm1516 n=1 Tax=Brugia malayi TaxID=6279 RepID=A0A0J9Y3L5_BRUMA|nr:Uncharacterized protein BM_BM1516 [Brugia malayi]CDQ00990.1 Bm1516 [Brugia malayi]VIO86711.1 Uncharacterized protein BM_BM1516 [Brugia malayi]